MFNSSEHDPRKEIHLNFALDLNNDKEQSSSSKIVSQYYLTLNSFPDINNGNEVQKHIKNVRFYPK